MNSSPIMKIINNNQKSKNIAVNLIKKQTKCLKKEQ